MRIRSYQSIIFRKLSKLNQFFIVESLKLSIHYTVYIRYKLSISLFEIHRVDALEITSKIFLAAAFYKKNLGRISHSTSHIYESHINHKDICY